MKLAKKAIAAVIYFAPKHISSPGAPAILANLMYHSNHICVR